MTEPGRLSRDHAAQLTGEQALPRAHGLSTGSYVALFKPILTFKRLLLFSFVSFDICSHLIGHFPLHSQYLNRFSTLISNVIVI